MSIAALDAFFGHQRGTLAMNEFLSMWKMTFEEANTLADLQMNNVAKSYLLLRNCGLSEKAKDDVKMHIGYDLRRFDEMFIMLQRMTTRDQAAAASSLPAMSKQFWAEDSWTEAPADVWDDDVHQTWYGDEWYDAYETSEWHDDDDSDWWTVDEEGATAEYEEEWYDLTREVGLQGAPV